MLKTPFFYITDPLDLPRILDECMMSKWVAIDTETTKRRDLPPDFWANVNEEIHKPGLDPWLSDVRLLQIGTPINIYVIDVWKVGPENIQQFGVLFNSFDVLKILMNAKFDMKQLMRGWGFKFERIYDVMLASKVLSNGIHAHYMKHNLYEIAKRYLGIELDKELQRSDWSKEELSMGQLAYGATDVDVLYPIMMAQSRCMVNNQKGINLVKTIKVENNCCIAVAAMELNGVYVDKRRWNDIDATLAAKFLDLKAKLITAFNKPDLNLESPAQIKNAFAGLGITLESTGIEVLEPLAKTHPVIALLVEYRGIAKLLSSCGNGIPGKKRKKGQVLFLERIHPLTGRVHAEFDQLGAETGRFSCNKPNFQNVPGMGKAAFRECVRGAIINDVENKYIVADYSNFEMRILADVSEEEGLIQAFIDGADIHTATASLMFNVPKESILYKDSVTHEKVKGPNHWMRQAAKCINFGLAYGRGTSSLSEQLGCSKEEAKELVIKYFKAYAKIQVWLERAAAFAQRNGYSLTAMGRVRYYEYDHSSNKERGAVGREGKNSPIQGHNADAVKIAMYDLQKVIERDYQGIAWVCNVVHDELGVECLPEYVEEVALVVKRVMEESAQTLFHHVPIIAEYAYGDSWACKE